MTFIGADASLPNLLEHIQAFLADKAYAVTALLRQPERDSHQPGTLLVDVAGIVRPALMQALRGE